MNYREARGKAKRARAFMVQADDLLTSIDDEHLITERTVTASLIRRLDKYIASLQGREQKSKAMKKRRSVQTRERL